MSLLHRAANAAHLASITALAAGCASRGAAPPAPPQPTPPQIGHSIAPAAPRAGEEPAPMPEGLAALLALAEAGSPRIAAAHAAYESAAEGAPQVGALPDPRVSLRWYAEEVESRVGPQEWGLGLSQTFPLAGKLGRREALAHETAAAAWYRLEDERRAVYEEVEDAWLEAAFVERAIAVVASNLDLAADLERVALSLFETGRAAYRDVLRAQVELGVIEDRLRSLEDQRRPVLARLNAALGRPVGAAVRWPAELPEGAQLPADLLAQAPLSGRSGELLALEREISAAERALALAEVEGVPDLTVGLDYIATGDAHGSGVSDSGKDPLVLSVGTSIPVWRGRYDAAEREARADLRAARARHRAALDRISAEAERAHFAWRDAARRVDLYARTLLPRADQSLAETDAAFRAGSADFLDLVDAQEVRLEFELGLARARTDRAQARAHLRRLLGPLPGEAADTATNLSTSEEGDR